MLIFNGFSIVLLVCAELLLPPASSEEPERHPNDGWYNNLIHPDWGAIDTHILRRSFTNYSDGVYEPSGTTRPNPFNISTIAFNGSNIEASVRKRTALMVFFGQQLVEEVVDAQTPGCPIEYYNIPVPLGHKYNPHNRPDLAMPFLRARYDQRTGFSPNNPRQQLNEITPYMDGNLVYGTSKAVEDSIRAFKDGLLKAENQSADVKDSFPAYNNIRLPYANPPSPRDNILRPVDRFRMYGNPRTHENPFVTVMAAIWFRYHNYVAVEIKKKNSSLNDEQIFLAARKRVIGQYQSIATYEWLPQWLQTYENGTHFDFKGLYPYEGGGINPYKGYDPNVHPGISTEFVTAAMRFGHTLVPSGVLTRSLNPTCDVTNRQVKTRFTTAKDKQNASDTVKVDGIRLCNSFWIPEEYLHNNGPGMDQILRGMMYTLSAKEDNIVVTDIRENVFGTLDWSRRDLPALNIQRARDHGLPSYNDIREAYGLPRRKTWTEINPNISQILDELKTLYGGPVAPDNLDLFPGGLLETTFDGPGPTFRAILIDQFLRIRHGDRFWFENRKNKLFTEEEIREIHNTSMYDVLDAISHVITPETSRNVFICTPEPNATGCQCLAPAFDPINADHVVEVCEPLHHYDYFSGSEVSFILTLVWIILSIPATIGIMMCIARCRRNSLAASSAGPRPDLKAGPNYFYATEWMGRSAHGLLNSRDVKISLDDQRLKIMVANMRGHVVRMIDLRRRVIADNQRPRSSVTRSSDKGSRLMTLAVPGEIDLVLFFPSRNDRDHAFTQFQGFFTKHNWTISEGPVMAEHVIWREASTIDERKKVLAKFFKSVLAELSEESTGLNVQQKEPIEEVLTTQLTRTEFADALGLQPHSLFVRNMFLLVDSSGDGLVSFDEFKNYFAILVSGKPEQKAEMFFKMFDTSRTGKLTKENYKKMIMSLVELNEAGGGKNLNINEMVDTVFKQIGKYEQGYLTLQDFKTVMLQDSTDIWKAAVLNLDVGGETAVLGADKKRRPTVKERAVSFVAGYQQKVRPTSYVSGDEIRLPSQPRSAPKSNFERRTQAFARYVNNHRSQIFWLSLYTLVTLGIFIERAFYYSVEREHAGLRRMAGYGVSVTRGAASAQMFTYASLLVTMSRNTLTFFRETFLHRFIPFDSAHDMHIYIAAVAMFFSLMHTIGHVINFYHISTQPSSDSNCYFREYFRSTDVLASFHYWAYETITGLTGLALVVLLVIIYVFATPYARRHAFKYFKSTHSLYIAVYILMFLHGSARLVQPPLWGWFFIGPVILFVLDKLVSVSRNKVLLPVHRATLLPSEVISLVFKRPLSFDYQSGQWVRIACPVLGKGEYHPFTLTSAPHEDRLSLHIRAVGPWTSNLRRMFDANVSGNTSLPMIYLDGPFGESHQDWFRYPVSVLVGGGIGVTPFASILKDIAYRSKEITRLPCRKVYFLWVTRSQQSFEWMTDIIRQVEAADNGGLVQVHICITQLKEQFDLRTTMLYICERHFQKIAGLSMFTGLRAKTHFGRPKFAEFFQVLKLVHTDVSQIGIFSCGPPAMTNNIQQACAEENAVKGPSLIHHYENF